MNVATDPWIPVQTSSGEYVEVSLLDAFENSTEIRRVFADNPFETRAIERLLIALAYRARFLDVPVATYLVDNLALFEIERFCQYDIESSGSQKSFQTDRILFPENTRDFFPESISPAKAARALLARILYDPEGIRTGVFGDAISKDNPRSMPIGPAWLGRPPTVIVHLDNLGETIAWNLPDQDPRGIDDIPIWEDDPTVGRRVWKGEEIGPCRLLIWPGRRMRLQFDDQGNVSGAVLTNGDVLEKKINLETVEPHGLWHWSKNTKRISHRDQEWVKGTWDCFIPRGGPLPVGISRLVENPRPATIVTITSAATTKMEDVKEESFRFNLDHVPLEEIDAIEKAIYTTEQNPGQYAKVSRTTVAPQIYKWLAGTPNNLSELTGLISQTFVEIDRKVFGTPKFHPSDEDQLLYFTARKKWEEALVLLNSSMQTSEETLEQNTEESTEVKKCSIDGCEREHWAKGLCLMHYKRKRKNGTTNEATGRISLDADGKQICAECSKSYDNLAAHVKLKHGLSAEQYKEKHNLPPFVKLQSQARLQRISEKSKARIGSPGWNKFTASRDPEKASHSRTSESFDKISQSRRAKEY